MPPSKLYVVLIKSGSRLRISPDEPLRINFNVGENSGTLTFFTSYIDEGFSSKVPRELWIEARGFANSLDEAIESFSNISNTILAIISVCMNGFAGESQFSIGYEITPNINSHEFFEQFIEDEKILPFPSRKINPDLVLPVIEKLYTHRSSQKLLTAIGQYVLALGYWKQGSETLSTAHLFMGHEALVKVVLELEIGRLNFTNNKDLANAWNIDITQLDSKVREKLLFDGDNETYIKAKEASDGFEHGFLGFNQIRAKAEKVRDKTAYYLRQAILNALDLPEDIQTKLLSYPYNQPVGVIGYIRYLRGNLIGVDAQLAAKDQLHPFVEWKFLVKSFSLFENKFNITFDQQITPRIGEGVTFSPKSFEIYGPEGFLRIPNEIKPTELDLPEPSKNREDVIRFSENVWKTASEYGNNRSLEGSIINVMVFSLFSTCLGLYHSVLTLLKNGLTTESYKLTWELWKNTLYLCQIADANNNAALVLGIEKQLINQFRADSHSHSLQNRILKLFNRNVRIGKVKKILNQTKRKFKIHKFQRPLSLKISCEKYCSPECNKILSDLDGIGESSMLLNPNLNAAPENNTFTIENHTFAYEDTAILIGLSSEAILSACKSVELIFGWNEIENFTSARTFSIELLRAYNTEK